MLETLNRYGEDSPLAQQLSAPLAAVYRHDRRFPRILLFSVISHVIFYAVLVNLDLPELRERAHYRSTELVQIAEVAPPPELSPLRRAPESLDRADLSNMEMDPNRSDQVLTARSPRPAPERGKAAKTISSGPSNNPMRAGSPAPVTHSSRQVAQAVRPPLALPIPVSRAPLPIDPALTQPAPVRPLPMPPAPPAPQVAPPAQAKANEPPQSGAPRGQGNEAKALGLESVQTQYHAYVRARIREQNEKIMPRDWIMERLTETVSAVFVLQLKRGGEIVSARMIKPTGYKLLDGRAREAIYTAQPFQGWPSNAGDVLTFTVTVSYSPLR